MRTQGPHVRGWIKQFDLGDQGLAEELIRRLDFTPTDLLIREISAQCQDIIGNSKSSALIPIRELLGKKDEETYFPNDHSDLEVYENIGDHFMVDKKCDVSSVRPILLNPTSSPGSEAILAQLATRLSRSFRTKVLSVKKEKSLSLSELRSRKCSDLILLDDIIASGRRAEEFLKSLFKNKSLNSWVSGGLINIHVVSYMRSSQSKYLETLFKQKLKIHSIRQMPTFRDQDPELARALEELCRTYSRSNERYPIGIGDCFSRAVFEHSVPNNTPAILWREGGKIDPLFPNRSVPLTMALEANSAERSIDKTRHAFVKVLTLLHVSSAATTTRQISRKLGWELSYTKEILRRLELLGLVSSTGGITPEGKAELAYLDKASKDIEFNYGYYYPTS